MIWPTAHGRTPLWVYADVNPSTPEFTDLPTGAELAFVPLECVWPGDKADFSRRIPWSRKLTSYTRFRDGDVLLPKISPTFSHRRATVATITTGLGLATSEVHVVRPRKGVCAKWLAYVLRNSEFIGEGTESLYGVGNLRRISTQQVRDYGAPSSSLAQQTRAANFLDVESAKIDAMITDLDRLITTLQERRVEAVRAQMPKECDGIPLQYLVRFCNGKDSSSVQSVDGDVPVYGSGGIFAAATAHLYDGESVLFGRKGTLDKPLHVQGRFWTIDTMFYTELGPQVHGKWLYYWATTIPYENFATSTAQPSMTSAVLGRLQVPALPLHEQKHLADVLDQETAKIDSMIMDAEKLKTLLLERRSVLIDDVVTGRKKVA